MLRSLVGSEMCIRDSPDKGQSPAWAARCNIPAAGLRRSRAGPGAGCSSCLLYTSDAADDLLCVDLGGRRIIKKKKQIKHNIPKKTKDRTED